MRRCRVLLLFLLASCANANSSSPVSLPTDANVVAPTSKVPDSNTVTSPPPDPNHPTSGPVVRFMGRFNQANPNAVTFSWSGSTIITRFEGTSLDILLAEDENATYMGATVDNHYDVFVDGTLTGAFQAVHGVNDYLITPAGLAQGDHIVRVVKRTEAQIGEASFMGFVPNSGGRLLPAPLAQARRIEFIGDSITCGYGDVADTFYPNVCKFTPDTENADLSYAYRTGEALGADTIQVSFSGKGVVQNVDPTDDPYWTMPRLYPYTNAGDRSVLWDFNTWIPDVVVIVLGGNDYQGVNTGSGVPAPSDANFIAAYRGLIEQVRGNYPNATIVCGLGPMLYGNALTMASNNVQAAVEAEQAAGDTNLSFVAFPPDATPLPPGYGSGFGCDYHPDAQTQAELSALLVAHIKNVKNW